MKSHTALPYLFLGSGVSRRYLQLPDWDDLLTHFAEKVGLNYRSLLSKSEGNRPKVASQIAEKFHDPWWEAAEYAHQREQYPDALGAGTVLKIAIAEYLKDIEQVAVQNSEHNPEIEAMRTAVVTGVVTTNYDTYSESIFPDFDPFVGQSELLFGNAQFVGEIYKIHGSVDNPESIIITEEDYEDMDARNKYLAAKLLTIFAEHPVIFVGYSVNDDYIQDILSDLVSAVGGGKVAELGSRIYFVDWEPDDSKDPSISSTQLERGKHLLPITQIRTHDFKWIWDVLSQLERNFPTKVLKALKKRVYDLVANPSPDDKRRTVAAVPFESDDADDLRVVFAVGAFSDEDLEAIDGFGTRTLKRTDLEDDLLEISDIKIPAEIVLKTGIADQLKASKSWYLPVWKYLREYGRVAGNGTVNFDGLPDVIKDLAERERVLPANGFTLRRIEIFGPEASAKEILESKATLHVKMNCLLALLQENGREVEIKNALADWAANASADDRTHGSYRKVIASLDQVMFGPTYEKWLAD
ncbi:SIR2 family protein [Corynebacterium callunae]|uniref:SIR2 family protein n=1 Tax=Corynebacterium callunae TaxID=1721 RepID=UPI001FFEE7E5|nr:SIR2 family protein [Corynebacterium callunae]MCK2200195.1 SIR2 family protein [Corynebacterium callunae]